MTLEQLRIFVVVAELEHVTMASKKLNVTQSTVSAAIKSLEERHDAMLFHRIGRRVELTEVGRVFLDEARAVLGRVASAELTLTEFGSLKRGVLRLVVSQTVASYWLPEYLVSYRKRYPQIEIDLVIANTKQVVQSVIAGTAELGFVEDNIEEEELVRIPLIHDQLVLVGTNTVEQVDNEWLQKASWVMREPGSGTRAIFEETLKARGVDPKLLNVVLTLPSNESVRAAVESGAGFAVLSWLVVARALVLGTLHVIPFELPERSFFALRHKERYLSKAVDALLNLIKDNTK